MSISVNAFPAEENRVRLRRSALNPLKQGVDTNENGPIYHSPAKINSQQLAERFVKNCAGYPLRGKETGAVRFINVSISEQARTTDMIRRKWKESSSATF
jgi:hypothetical protein